MDCRQGLALLTLSWDKNWDSHSLVNGYPSFYPRIALVAPSPGRCQSIISTNAGILLIGPLGSNFNEILITIHTVSFQKIHLKMLSGNGDNFFFTIQIFFSWEWIWTNCTFSVLENDVIYEYILMCPQKSLTHQGLRCASCNVQCSAVITTSIFWQIFTKDTT